MTRVVCLCFLVAALIGFSACSASKQSLVEKGNKLYTAGKYEEAALNFRAAIQKDPSFGEAHYRLGLAEIKLDHPRPAYAALLRAAQLLPGDRAVKEKFADVCLSLYLADPAHSQILYDQIRKLSDEFLAVRPNSYEGLMLKGYLASTDKKPKEAIEYFRQALKANQSNDGVVTELAHLLIQDGEADEGKQLVANLVGTKKTAYGPAYDLLYSLYVQANRPIDAENVLRAKVANNPRNADDVIELAAYYRATRNNEAMTSALERLLDDPEDFPQARLWVGDFYLRQRDYDQAIRYYQEGARDGREAKSKTVYGMRCVLALTSEGKRDEALSLAGKFQRENPKDNAILRMHADLLLAGGQRKNADVAVKEFETLERQNPGDVALRMQLGRAYRFKGDLKNARAQFAEALHEQTDLADARYELAEIGLLEGHPEEAVQQASEILRTKTQDRQARLLYAAGLSATGDQGAARAVLAEVIKDFPQDPASRVQMGLLALAENNFPQAIQILSQYRANGGERGYAALAHAYVHEKQFDQAREVLNEGLAKFADSSQLLEQLADTETLSGHYDIAVTEYQKALAEDPVSTEIRRHLAEVYDREGDHTRALSTYQEAHRLAPNDVVTAVNLAEALAQAGRLEEARALYETIASAHPESAPALNNAAFFLADTGGNLDEALRLAQNALARVPGQPSFSDTIAYIYLKKGMLDSAIQSFSTLARRYPGSASFRYHLGLALFQKGEKAGARKELEAALNDHPSAQDALRIRELLNAIS